MFEVSGALFAILVFVVVVGLYSGPRGKSLASAARERAIIIDERNKSLAGKSVDAIKQGASNVPQKRNDKDLSPRDKAAMIGAALSNHSG